MGRLIRGRVGRKARACIVVGYVGGQVIKTKAMSIYEYMETRET